jgi:hypothetical protein
MKQAQLSIFRQIEVDLQVIIVFSSDAKYEGRTKSIKLPMQVDL